MKPKEIGGYFELELPKGREFHEGAIKLNSARYCILEILKFTSCIKVYLPTYICDSIIDLCRNQGILIEFYDINEQFLPVEYPNIKENEFILYVNYFGANNRNVEVMINKYENIIIDNTQAFFCKILKPNVYSVYSARKFFGVCDGGYLYGKINMKKDFYKDISYDRASYMLKRYDLTASSAYDKFQENEKYIDHTTTKLMSDLTSRILSGIDYENVIQIRNNNFKYLHKWLKGFNMIRIEEEDINGAMVYPLLIQKEGIKEHLINNKVYIASYWSEVLDRAKENSFEQQLSKYLIPLPIDQRYDIEDMNFIKDLIIQTIE